MTTVTYKGWKIFNYEDPMGKNAYNYTYCTVSDPRQFSRSSREISEISIDEENGVASALNFIKDELQNYDSWAHFDTVKEIESHERRLKIEIEKNKKLTSQISEYKKEVGLLKEVLGEGLYQQIKEENKEIELTENIIDMMMDSQIKKYEKIKKIIVKGFKDDSKKKEE